MECASMESASARMVGVDLLVKNRLVSMTVMGEEFAKAEPVSAKMTSQGLTVDGFVVRVDARDTESAWRMQSANVTSDGQEILVTLCHVPEIALVLVFAAEVFASVPLRDQELIVL